MTHLRKMMLEELERRNYAQTTIDCYIQTIEEKPLCRPRPTDEKTSIVPFACGAQRALTRKQQLAEPHFRVVLGRGF